MTSTTQVNELCTWLDQIPFSRQKKNMPRDFSDGVMMAELLKYFHPKLVELHNYPPTSCLTHKVNNWTTLNRKVFLKLGIKLHKQQIEQLASAEPGAIVHLLTSLKNKMELASRKIINEQKQQEQFGTVAGQQGLLCMVQEGLNKDTMLGVPLPCEPGSGQRLIIAMESMVPQRQLDEKLAEIEEKDEAIEILIQKVSHLDTLLRFKDQRIKDLTQQLQFMKAKTNSSQKAGSDFNFADSQCRTDSQMQASTHKKAST